MKKIGIILCVIAGVLLVVFGAVAPPLIIVSLLIAGVGVVFITVPEEKLKSIWEKIQCTFSSKKRQEIAEREQKIKEAEEEKARLKREEEARRQEECAKNGHKWERLPYEPDFFTFKEDLFECLPLDRHAEEECSVCGATRKTVIKNMREISVPEKLRSSIFYNSKEVGIYELKLNEEKSYCIRAKKDIPKMSIQKGQLFLVLTPKYEEYYAEKDIPKYYEYYEKEDILSNIKSFYSDAKIPKDFHKLVEYLDDFPDFCSGYSEVFYDNGDMPGMVEFSRFVTFVDEESNEILSSAPLDLIEIEDTSFKCLKIGLLEIPDHGTLKVFCKINTESSD